MFASRFQGRRLRDSRFICFAITGLNDFWMDATIVWSLTFTRIVMAALAQCVAVLAVAAITWAINRHLTFSYFRPSTGRARELGRYHTVNAAGGLGNNAFMWCLCL